MEQIATSSNEQSTGSKEVSKNIEGVSLRWPSNRPAAPRELTANAQQLDREVKGLNEILG